MHLTLSLLLLAGLPASAQTPSTTSAAATATDQTVLLLLGAAWAASSEAELAAREADASVLMDGIRAGMTGVVTTGEVSTVVSRSTGRAAVLKCSEVF
jgi:hypothetical protein